MKGLMVFYGGSTMFREWRRMGLLRGYVEISSGSRSVGRPRKMRINTVKDIFKKRLDARQQRRMMQDRSEWHGFVREMHGE